MLDGADAPMNQFDVHPAAAVFPMMSEDELNDLAADIEAHGLLHPIVLDYDGEVLIDGRNRLEACYRAGVEPQFRRLNDEDDHLAFIASANLARRNLSKGQQAMAMAMLYPEPEKGGRGKLSGFSDSLGVSGGHARNLLSQARTVLHHSRALAEDVLGARKKLDAALAQVQREREAAVSAEAQLSALSQYAPDLAEMVEDERLSLAEATAALKQRQEDEEKAERNKRITYLRLCEAASSITALANEGFIEGLCARLEADEEFRTEWQARVRFAAEHPDELKPGVNAFAKLLKHYGVP